MVQEPVPKDYESRMTPELKTVLELGQLKGDNMSKMKETYAALNIEPSNTRYGGCGFGRDRGASPRHCERECHTPEAGVVPEITSTAAWGALLSSARFEPAARSLPQRYSLASIGACAPSRATLHHSCK